MRSEAEQHAVEFLKKVVRVPGASASNRDDFLYQELREREAPTCVRWYPLAELDRLAEQVISYETKQVCSNILCCGYFQWICDIGTIPGSYAVLCACSGSCRSLHTSTDGPGA